MNSNDFDEDKIIAEIDNLEDSIDDKPKKRKKVKFNTNVFFVVLLFIVLVAYVGYERVFKEFRYLNDLETEEIDYEAIKARNEENFKTVQLYLKTGIEIGKDDIVYVKLENPTDFEIFNFTMYLILYDGENNVYDIKNEYVTYLGAHQKRVIQTYNTGKNYERAVVFISKDYFDYSGLENLADKIEYNAKINNDKIEINVENNSDSNIDEILFEVVFYDGEGKIIGCDRIFGYNCWKKSFVLDEYLFSRAENYERYEVNLIYAFK